MDIEQVWRDQLLCFCPSLETLQQVANGTDGITNIARRSAARALCEDCIEWRMPIEELVLETRRNISPSDENISWMPESTMPMEWIIAFFHERQFDFEREQHLFEAEDHVAEEDLQKALALPYEIGIARLGKRKVVWSGKNLFAYSKNENPILHHLDLHSDVFLHTHRPGTVRVDSPSWSDLLAAESPKTKLLIAHKGGLIQFNGFLLEEAYVWMQKHGVREGLDCKVPHQEFAEQMRKCAIEIGIIQKEGPWDGKECEELMVLLNGEK